MKLHAFIREYDVNIQVQEHGSMNFRMGSLGFTRRWGNAKERQPIDVELRFETTRTISKVDNKPKTMRRIMIRVTPHGRPADMTAFASRCGILIRELHAYLLGS